MANASSLTSYAWLSITAAVVTIGLKMVAYLVTGSVGLLSDAMESLINLLGALMALAMLMVSARPADEDHAFGHSKAEYFSSGFEGSLILLAAIGISIAAIDRLLSPKPIEQLGIGVGVSVLASAVNLLVAAALLRAGKRHNSITLQANARHLMTDVWTSGGVLVGIGAVALTGWQRLDPIVALVVAANIVWSGVQIVRDSVSGLMDKALSAEDQDRIREALKLFSQSGMQYHALRTRQAGARRFVSVHVIVPGDWTVHRGHALLEQIENEIRRALPSATVFTHLESLDDPASWQDLTLDRSDSSPPQNA